MNLNKVEAMCFHEEEQLENFAISMTGEAPTVLS